MPQKLQIIEPVPRDNLAQLSDDELMVLVVGDHKAPLEELVKRHHPVVLGYAARFLNDHSLGCEITQEVFLTVWQERRKYKPRGKFRSYALAIAFNRCQAATRRRKTVFTKQPALAEATRCITPQGPLELLLEAERATHLQRQMMNLSSRTRQALLLRFCSGLSYDEISAATGQRPGTIKSRVCRGIKELLGQLDEEYRS